ncbi:MAG: glycine--tRNA ligase [bacterium]|nr:glycine--tRNA ligase [bacterium]
MKKKEEKKKEEKNVVMENLISLCKRRGFIFQGSEIYGGLAGTWDYGPLGTGLKDNIKNLWLKRFVIDRNDMFKVDATILMNQNVWKASGHVSGFTDPMADGSKFNTMFSTSIGAGKEAMTSYLRPETAQGMFVNFKNIIDSFHPTLPFGMAQIGKAFRNEISPRDFLFRTREFEQMEIEYFVDPRNEQKIIETFDALYSEQMRFLADLGLEKSRIHKIEVPADDRAHYSKRSVDTEFDFPFGQRELLGIAYRTDYDLKAHMDASGVDLSYFDEETKQRFVPHCIEPTFGVDRLVLAVLSQAYGEDSLGGEKRVYLKLSPSVAPVKIAVFPLQKNKEVLVSKAQEIYKMLRKQFEAVLYDDTGSIGKRYRRQDEIGTPYCVTIDFDTVEKDDSVTVRDRDTGEQERVVVKDLISYLENKLED